MRLSANPLGLVFPLALLLPPLALAQDLGIDITRPVECERQSKNGDTLAMMYRGTLQKDGSQFDSSYDRGKPFRFKLGAGQVIAGWEKGLLDMCPGEARTLTIPPNMGYGEGDHGPIPGGSTLIFTTELVEIEGVEPAPRPTKLPEATPQASPAAADQASAASPAASPSKTTITQGSPIDISRGKGECNLLGNFALLVQGALGLLAVSSLVVKRWREEPRRPVKIWFFDVSKQVFGSVLLHLANILMSMLSSGKFDVAATSLTVQDDKGDQPNPCSFYLLNLAIDTTIGIPILVLLLKVLHRGALLTPLANPPESIRSGNYGHPPRATWWLKQSVIYFLGLLLMKLCVLALFALLPWIAWVGDWALRWTEGNTAVQITFVMFIFPLIMNALQYWIIDSFIKDPVHTETGYHGVLSDDEDEHDSESDEEWLERQQRRREHGLDGDADSDLDDLSGKPLAKVEKTKKEPRHSSPPSKQTPRNKKHEQGNYDPDMDGDQGGSAGSSRDGSKRRVEYSAVV